MRRQSLLASMNRKSILPVRSKEFPITALTGWILALMTIAILCIFFMIFPMSDSVIALGNSPAQRPLPQQHLLHQRVSRDSRMSLMTKNVSINSDNPGMNRDKTQTNTKSPLSDDSINEPMENSVKSTIITIAPVSDQLMTKQQQQQQQHNPDPLRKEKKILQSMIEEGRTSYWLGNRAVNTSAILKALRKRKGSLHPLNHYRNVWMEQHIAESLSKIDIKPDDRGRRIQIISASMVDSLHFQAKQKSVQQFESSHVCYSSMHGYPYLSLRKKQDWFDIYEQSKLIDLRYQKVAFLLYLLLSPQLKDKIDWFAWMDGDILIMDCDPPFQKHALDYSRDLYNLTQQEFDDNIHIVFSGDIKGTVNNGVFLIRNSEWSSHFVKRWLATAIKIADYDKVRGWKDQGVLLFLLNGWQLNDPRWKNAPMEPRQWFRWYNKNVKSKFLHAVARTDETAIEGRSKVIAKEIRDHVLVVGQRHMNAFHQNWEPGDFVVHMAGQKQKDKVLELYVPKVKNCPCFHS